MIHFLFFPSILEKALFSYEPSLIASYAYDLCKKFNQFYYQHNILKEGKNKKKRLQLTRCTKIILEKIFDIMGIPPLPVM